MTERRGRVHLRPLAVAHDRVHHPRVRGRPRVAQDDRLAVVVLALPRIERVLVKVREAVQLPRLGQPHKRGVLRAYNPVAAQIHLVVHGGVQTGRRKVVAGRIAAGRLRKERHHRRPNLVEHRGRNLVARELLPLPVHHVEGVVDLHRRSICVHALRKVTLPLQRGRHTIGVGLRLAQAQPLVRSEEEQLVALHKAADAAAELVPVKRRTRNAVVVVVPAVRVQLVVAEEFKRRPVEAVAAALGDQAHHAAVRVGELRVIGCPLDLNFLRRVHVRRRDRATQVRCHDGRAVDQHRRRFVAAAIQRKPVLVLIGRVRRQTCPHRHHARRALHQVQRIPEARRQAPDRLLRNRHLAVGRLGVHLDLRRVYRHALVGRTKLQVRIVLCALAADQGDVLLHKTLEARRRHGQLVGSRRQLLRRKQAVAA